MSIKKILLFTTFIFVIANAMACDICGCSSGGNSLGILPGFNRSFIGVRYQYRAFNSKAHEVKAEKNTGSKEFFNTTELWGRWVPLRWLQFFVFVPYNNTKRIEQIKTTSVSGLGDLSILGSLVILNTGDSNTKKLKQALQIGGGIKLPTGKHDIVREGLMLHQNIQPGTGSLDVPINVIYTLRNDRFGINYEVNYSINSINNQHCKFGNKLSSTLRVFYLKKVKQFRILPHTGVTFDKSAKDEINGEKQDYTGGKSLLANAGIDLYHKNFSLGISIKKPIIESLAGGHVKSVVRSSVHLIYLF